MPCPFCHTSKTNPRAQKTALGYATFYCPACRRTFNERTGTPFNELQTRSEIVFLVVLWRLRYKLSLRDVAEMMLERNITITYETVRLWEGRFAPLLTAQLKAMKTFKTMKSDSRFCSAFEEQRAYFRERHGKNVTWKPYMKRGMFKARFLKLRYEFHGS